jgi:RNA polymerase sigma-70 factor (ECF subfamily)
MSEAGTTRASLLVRIRDCDDDQAWSQFVEIYAPLVYGFARRHGLQDADASDLTQDVLQSVARAARTLDYDPARGSFRGWLFTIVRNKLRDLVGQCGRQVRGTGDTSIQNLLNDQPAHEAEESAIWEREHERRLFTWAGEQVSREVQTSTWQAFWLTAVEGKSGHEVANSLGMTVAAVYLAKSRVMSRLKQKIQEVQADESDLKSQI